MKKFKLNTKPYAHQVAYLNQFGQAKACALLADMGTGKTWMTLANIVGLYNQGKVDAVLVFAPNGVHTNWVDLEIPKHLPTDMPLVSHAWDGKNSRKTMDSLHKVMEPQEQTLRVFTMNWEALQHKRGQEAAMEFCESSTKLMIVCDEAHYAKNPTSIRAKSLLKLRGLSAYRRILTGTPVSNAPFDLFAPFKFLDPKVLGTSFFAFKAEFAELLRAGDPRLEAIRGRIQNGRTPQIVATAMGADGKSRPIYRNLDKLSHLIAPHSFRVLKSECLDLPDKIYKSYSFRLTKEQVQAYLLAEEECRLVFQDEIAIITRLTAIQKLSQITSGYFIHPMGDELVRIEGANPKLELLRERIETITEHGAKVIIWARYRAEISDIVAMLGELKVECVEYHGGVNTTARKAAMDSFQDGEAQVFVGNQQAGGTGITLTAATFVVYFSNTYSLTDRLQSEDRAHRIGQTSPVTYIDLVGKGTVDEDVVSALTNKKDVADEIIDRGLALYKESTK